jgi:hypothetical protein
VIRKLTLLVANIAFSDIFVGFNVNALLAFLAVNLVVFNSIRGAAHIAAVVSAPYAGKSLHVVGLASQALHIVYWWFVASPLLLKSISIFSAVSGPTHIIKLFK